MYTESEMPEVPHSSIFSESMQADQIEVLGKSMAAADFIIATERVPNLEDQVEIVRIRKLIATIRDSEDILKLCVRSSDIDQLHLTQIPLILRMATERLGVTLTDQERKNVTRVFTHGHYDSIHLYLDKSCGQINVFKALCEYSQYYFEHKYLLTLTKQAKSLIQTFLPEFAIDFPYRVGFKTELDMQGDIAEYYPSLDGIAKIQLITNQDLSKQREYASLETGGMLESQSIGTTSEHRYQRKIHDLIVAVHEYAHGVYEQNVHSRAKQKLAEVIEQDAYYATVDAAYNEGFAILVEFLIVNKLLLYADTLGLGERDIEDLRWWKSQRFESLIRMRRHEKQLQTERNDATYLFKGTAYSEGFVRIFSRQYREGGTAKVNEFLESIDPTVSLAAERSTASYRQAVGYVE